MPSRRVQTVEWGHNLWLALTQDQGLVLAGTGDVPVLPLDRERLQAVLDWQTGRGPVDPEVSTAAWLRAEPGPAPRAVPSSPAVGPPCDSDVVVRWGATLILRVVDGRVLGWSEPEQAYVDLSPAQVELLVWLPGERHVGSLAVQVPTAAEAIGGLLHHGILAVAERRTDPGRSPVPALAEAQAPTSPEEVAGVSPVATEPGVSAEPAPANRLMFRARGRARRGVRSARRRLRTGVRVLLGSHRAPAPDAVRGVERVGAPPGSVSGDEASVDLVPPDESGHPIAGDHPDDPRRALDRRAAATIADEATPVEPPAEVRPGATVAAAPGSWLPGPKVPLWFATCALKDHDGGPLALGMILSAVVAHDHGALLEAYEPTPIRLLPDEVVADVESAARPGVLLCSSYLWTLSDNLALADRVKAAEPASLVVFGGPSVPKYEAEAEAFLHANPQVDLLVRGEGEVTACRILEVLREGGRSWQSQMSGVPGLTFLDGDRVVRTDEPERIVDVNDVPSPYLAGYLDHLEAGAGVWTIETNRGCPYGCTFCDWGSATLSRVRKYDLDRVRAEIRWLGRHQVETVFMADANFGMFERDVEIAEMFAETFEEFGAPRTVAVSFAKNSTKHTAAIIDIWVRAGIMSEGVVSFQTTDAVTLTNVRRRNVKTSTYLALASEMRDRDLPIAAELMIGLPGSTLETLKTDLQVCIDGEVRTRVYATMMLPNSPMNDPEYRAEHQIEIDSHGQVISCSSYTREERDQMVRFADVFRLAQYYGVFRHLMRYAARERSLREIDVLATIYEAGRRQPDEYPLLAFFLVAGRVHLTVPVSWDLLIGEARMVLVRELGMVDDSAMAVVAAVQAAVLPVPGKVLPLTLPLAHDYVRYYQDGSVGQASGRSVRPLREYEPGEITIDDPLGICSDERAFVQPFTPIITDEGSRREPGPAGWVNDHDWELASPLKRVGPTSLLSAQR